MKYILRREHLGLGKSPRYRYFVEDEFGKTYTVRKSNRDYNACLFMEDDKMSPIFWGRIDLIGKNYSKSTIKYLDKNSKPYSIVYNENSIEKLIYEAYNKSMQDAFDEADKHAGITGKYCSQCDNYTPCFKHEKYCLICGSAHDGRKDPDLSIPLENKI